MKSESERAGSNEECFRLYLEGNDKAFEKLVDVYEDELLRFINSIINDYHESEHLMIEAFAKLAEHGGRFAGKSSLKTYLFAIGKNLAFTYVKKRRREHHISYEECLNTLPCLIKTVFHISCIVRY